VAVGGRVVVAIATRGDRSLQPLVDAIHRQTVAASRIVIATQGGTPPGADSADASLPITVIHARGPGYARGRNALLRFLALTCDSWDLVAFIDDDEEPAPRWLEAHARTLETYGADVSFGPIHRRWPESASAAVRRADLPRRPTMAEGPYHEDGRTGNCCLRLDALHRGRVRFDERFDTTGGEDTAFFEDLRRRGAEFAWSPDASVVEEMPPAASTAQAFLKRAYRNGCTLPVLVDRGYEQRRSPWPPMGQGKRIPKSAALLVAGALTGRRDLLLRSFWESAYVAGLTMGLLRRRSIGRAS
jgi:succinoglycan biosynthesis protein ExoM